MHVIIIIYYRVVHIVEPRLGKLTNILNVHDKNDSLRASLLFSVELLSLYVL